MKYLIFAELNRNHFLFLTYFIISFIKAIVNRYIKTTEDIVESFHVYYIYTLSDFLSIIPLIIIKVRSKSTSTKDRDSLKLYKTETYIKYIYTDVNKKRKKRIFKLSILVSILEFIALYINSSFTIIVSITNFTFIHNFCFYIFFLYI